MIFKKFMSAELLEINVPSQTVKMYNTENFFLKTMGQILHKRSATT